MNYENVWNMPKPTHHGVSMLLIAQEPTIQAQKRMSWLIFFRR